MGRKRAKRVAGTRGEPFDEPVTRKPPTLRVACGRLRRSSDVPASPFASRLADRPPARNAVDSIRPDQPLMPAVVQDFVRKPGVVGETVGRQRDGVGPGGARQTLARQRIPHRLVEKPRRMLAADHGIAEMEVIGMGLRKSANGDFARPRPLVGGIGKTRERLQNGQRA